MGRGRAKAKQTKVARELKYSSPNTDYESLQRELSSDSGIGGPQNDGAGRDDDEDGHDDYRR